jgi:hypothetical protein
VSQWLSGKNIFVQPLSDQYKKPALCLKFWQIERKIADKSHVLAGWLKDTAKIRRADVYILGFFSFGCHIWRCYNLRGEAVCYSAAYQKKFLLPLEAPQQMSCAICCGGRLLRTQIFPEI